MGERGQPGDHGPPAGSRPRRRWRAGVALLLLALAAPAPLGAQIRAREERLTLAPGATVRITGTIPRLRDGDLDRFLLSAREGQRLRVRLETADRAAYLTVYAVDGTPPQDCLSCGPGGFSRFTPPPPELRAWSGRLPLNGDVAIQVHSVSSEGLPYVLTVGLQ